MNTKLYVGNIPFDTTEQDLADLFAQYGEVAEIAIPMDRDSGRPRGFAFVTMADPQSMGQAIEELSGQDFNGRSLVVNEAKPPVERSRGGFRNDRGGRRDDRAPRRDDRSGGGYGRGRRY